MRFIFLILVNVFLFEVYVVLYAFCLALSFVPIFPTRVGTKNFRERLGASFFKSRFLMSSVYMHYFFYFIEAAVLFPLRLTQVDGVEEFCEFLKRLQAKYGKGSDEGFVVLGAHYSNIEETGGAVSDALAKLSTNAKFVCLAKPSRVEIVTRVFDWYRSKHGIDIVWTHRKDLVRELIKNVKSGNSLGYLIDQKPAARGAFIQFIGAYAAFPIAGLEVPVRAGLPVVHVVTRRIFPGYFQLVFEEGYQQHLGVSSEGIAQAEYLKGSLTAKEEEIIGIMACYAYWLEKVIRKSPAQWSWDYKKWSRKPQAKVTE